MLSTAVAKIDLSAIRFNLTAIRTLCGKSSVMAVIKANAYGHGLVQTAKALDAADGLAVARLQEAVLLRKSGIQQRLLLLPTLVDHGSLAFCASHDIDVVAHDQCSLHSILTQARITPLRVWLKLDSGMHRAGFAPSDFERADSLLREHDGILDIIHMTHFANAADDRSRLEQLDCFARCHEINPSAAMSSANSAALITDVRTRHHWVRPGIMVYGVDPTLSRSTLPLRPVMTLASYVICTRRIKAGEAVGYDGRWTSTRDSRIGTIGIGYGDGYPRHAKSGTPVLINGSVVPLVGNVSMDSLMVDLTDRDDVSVGDEVILWGSDLPLNTVAECSSTIPYALVSSLTERVNREYV